MKFSSVIWLIHCLEFSRGNLWTSPINVTISEHMEVGLPFRIKVENVDWPTGILHCRFFIHESKIELLSNPSKNSRLTQNKSPLEDVQAIQSPKTCGLKGDKLPKSYLGQWTCQVVVETEHHGPLTSGVKFNILQKGEKVEDGIKLPESVQPEMYSLSITPELDADQSVGSVEIDASVKLPKVNKIILHARASKILIRGIKLHQSKTMIPYNKYILDWDRDLLELHLNRSLDEHSNIKIAIMFSSQLRDDGAGFFKQNYYDLVSESHRILAATTMWPTEARTVFPCFDQPDFKAKFQINVGRPSNMTSVSNMAIQATSDHPLLEDHKTDTYEVTPVMSTYLVAFMVSNFEMTTNPNDSSIRMWHRPGLKEQAKLSVNLAPQVLNCFENLLGISFAIPQLDMVAIPGLPIYAMENWGFVTYAENAILYDPKDSSDQDKETVVLLLSHELSHNWFGNLVTKKWWNNFWLNEGFAKHLEKVGTDAVLPEYRSLDRDVLSDEQTALLFDSGVDSRAISEKVINPAKEMSDILHKYFYIPYRKGSSLVKMMQSTITKITFYKGIRSYLTRNQYDNVKRADLWRSLTEAAREDGNLDPGYDFETLMTSWCLQSGYPALTFQKKDNNYISVTQRPFFLDPDMTSNATWVVPVIFDDLENGRKVLFLNETNPLYLDGIKNPYIINRGARGYYRINYDKDNWQQLTEILISNHETIPELNRAQIYDDALNLARSARVGL